MRRAGRFAARWLIWLSVAGFVASTAWWYLFFEQMLGQDVKRASGCFYQTTADCRLGNVLGTFGSIPAYNPVLLWLSAAGFGFGLLLYGVILSRPKRSK